ncbi:MAG: LysM peptidoglycan-binding domain-containing protein [Protaetiibacter sp.]
MIRRTLAGTASLLVLLAVLGGIPAFLIIVVGNPLPTADQWVQILGMMPDYGNEILLTKLLPCVAWIAWALFAGPWLYELITVAAGRQSSRRVWLFRGQQRMAAALVGAVLVMFAGAGSIATPGTAQAQAAAPSAVAQSFTETAPAAPAPAELQQVEEVAVDVPVERADVQHMVAPGDTLWDIAEHYLGAGELYPEIFDASAATVQPDGRHLTDPNLIYPGWQVTVPDAGEVIAPPAPEHAAPPVEPTAPEVVDEAPANATGIVEAATGGAAAAEGVGATGSSAERVDAQGEASDSIVAEADDPDFSIPLVTAAGVGSLLAAGLLLAIGRRRLRQRRRRAAGERIAMPEPAAADFELELRMVENPIMVEDLDHALRGLQIWAEDTGNALPNLLAVRVDGAEIALYLAEPAELPAPFESAHPDHTAWIVRPGTVTPPTRDAVSPFPALTTIGTDARGGILMLDLEQIGSLDIAAASDELARGVLTAMSVELASNPWSEGVRVTLVGIPVTLAREVDRFRVQHVDDVTALVRNLRQDLEDRRAALDSFNATDVHDARAHASEYESWAPHIVLLAEKPDDELGAQLAELVKRMPRLGIATVASGAPIAAAATITVTSEHEAEYRVTDESLPPLPFRPQILAGRELELVQSLFATTELANHPADLVTLEAPAQPQVEEPEESPVLEHEELEDTEDAERWTIAIPSVIASPAPTIRPAESVDEAPVVAVEVPVEVDDSVTVASPAAEVSIPDWPAPYLRMLGPIEALNAADTLPGRGIELLAYLTLQSGATPGAQIQKAMWPDKYDPSNNNLRTLAKQVRSALGNAPDGTPLLPEGRNSVGFTSHPAIRTDWDDFRELLGTDLTATSNENLVAAIRLVRGAPFTGANRRRGWWVWRAPIEEEMIALILDAADELASRALRRSDYDQARFAARIAQAADPLNELGWRLELRAAMQAGDVGEFNRVIDDLYARVGGTDPNYELDDTTQELVDLAHQKLTGIR